MAANKNAAFVTLPVAPPKLVKAGVTVVRDAIPLGQGQEVLRGVCNVATHKTYHGKAYVLYLLGVCGDHDMQVTHKSCKASGVPCTGRVFVALQPDGSRGCKACATVQRRNASK